MTTWTKRIYFNYQEIITKIGVGNYPTYPHDTSMDDAWFTNMIADLNLEFAVYTLSEYFTDSLINQIINALMGIVYNRHAEDYLPKAYIEYEIYDDAPDIDDLDSDALRKILANLINVIDLTLPRYIPLLQQNEIYSTNPVAPITSGTTGVTRFNDTPQDGGAYDDDEHTTNISESSSETNMDTGSIVSKLDEMFKNFRSIILEWSNEFDILFIKEEML